VTIDSFQGPLTAEDLQAIWEGAVDRSYREPLIAAGEGGGFEVYTQAFQQAARLSSAVDYSTQQLYIQPWSGQSGPPASGPSQATVQLSFSRSGFSEKPLVLSAGQFVDEVQLDHGPSGPVPVNTGRRYQLLENVVFPPGESGPFEAAAQAERPGFGYNNPLPGSISFVENVGTRLHNVLATLTRTAGSAPGAPVGPALTYQLVALDVTDMPVPANVGQYVLFTSGANEGAVALATGFISPDPGASLGSGLVLSPVLAFEGFTVAHAFRVGQPVQFFDSTPTLVATGVLLGAVPYSGGTKWTVLLQQGDPTAAVQMAQPQASGPTATSTMDVIQQHPLLTPEAPSGIPLAGGAGWQVLDWAQDWELTCTNAAQPEGGALGMLDLIGAERDLPRHFQEGDGPYRDRLWQIADVVTPNALRRALYQALGTIPWCYRETGDNTLPGFFYDRTGDVNGDFYDDSLILWEGTLTSGSFSVGDPIVYQRQVPASTGPWLVQAEGVFAGMIGPISTLVGARSNGVTLPQSIVYVEGLLNVPNQGSFTVGASTVTYTGVDNVNLAFTGCSGGTDTLATGEFVLIVGDQMLSPRNNGTLLFSPRQGAQAFEPVAGDRILNKRNGAVFAPASNPPNDFDVSRRWHVYLSYEDFRGYFLVEVPALGFGEFGLAYDDGPVGAYDAGPLFDDFYDGFPAGNPPVYLGAYNELLTKKLGGVGFDLFLTSGPCP
jgi:hypothetical protein